MVAWQHHSGPGWGLSTVVQPPLHSKLCCLPWNGLLKFHSKTPQLITENCHSLLSQRSVSISMCASACFCDYLVASRSEWVVRRDKDAGRPHPSPTSHINTYSPHTYSSMKMLCGNSPATLCWTLARFRRMSPSLIIPKERWTGSRLRGWAEMSKHINHTVWSTRNTQ